MGIGVVFEIIVSALAVLGIYALICEIERWLYCRRRYFIAVPAENGDPDTEGEAEAARRIARISTGARQEAVLLFEEEPDGAMRQRLSVLPGAAAYVRYSGENK